MESSTEDWAPDNGCTGDALRGEPWTAFVERREDGLDEECDSSASESELPMGILDIP